MELSRHAPRKSPIGRPPNQDQSLQSRHIDRKLPPLAADHLDSRLLKLLNEDRPEDARYDWLMGKLRRKLEEDLTGHGGFNLNEFEQYLKKLNSFMEEESQENQPFTLRPVLAANRTERKVKLRPLARRQN